MVSSLCADLRPVSTTDFIHVLRQIYLNPASVLKVLPLLQQTHLWIMVCENREFPRFAVVYDSGNTVTLSFLEIIEARYT